MINNQHQSLFIGHRLADVNRYLLTNGYQLILTDRLVSIHWFSSIILVIPGFHTIIICNVQHHRTLQFNPVFYSSYGKNDGYKMLYPIQFDTNTCCPFSVGVYDKGTRSHFQVWLVKLQCVINIRYTNQLAFISQSDFTCIPSLSV